MAPVYGRGAGRSVAQRRGAAVRVLADAPSMARAVFVLTAICCLQPASPHGSAASDECTGDNRAPLPRSWAPWCSFIICGREEDRPVDPCGCERKCDIPFAGQVRRRQVAPPVTLAHQISEAAQSGDFIRAGALQKAMEADRAGRQRGGAEGAVGLVYVHELPEGINAECEHIMRRWNWWLDMGFEEWPPKALGDMANMGYALEAVIHAVLLQSPWRTLDPSAADWFYIPFYAGCSWRESINYPRENGMPSEHDERLRTLNHWLLEGDVPSQYFGKVPHAITVGLTNDFESVGPLIFERAMLLTWDNYICQSGRQQTAAAPGDTATHTHTQRWCHRSVCHGSAYLRSLPPRERDPLFPTHNGQWCPRASMPADVAVPYFADPALAVYPSGDAWLRTRTRSIDFFMMATAHDISRNFLEDVFWDYDEVFAGEGRAHVRIEQFQYMSHRDVRAVCVV